MSNKNLFKEAIADAKAVREAALANAKAALEEALTPKLQSMLAAKLNEMEMEEEGLEEYGMEHPDRDMDGDGDIDADDVAKMGEGMYPDNTSDKIQDRYRATGAALEEDELEEDFDLSEILAELEEENENLYEAKEEGEEEESEEEESEDVADMSVEDLKALIKDIVAQEMGNEEGDEEEMSMDMGDEEADEESVPLDEDEINLEELLAELDALGEADDEKDPMEEAKKMKAKKAKEEEEKKEMKEAIATINTLRSELNEVNLLNAKLLYVNKIFKSKNLSESQKLKVIASFDKATTAKEAKVVFESLNNTLTAAPKQAIKESIGFASRAAGVAPKKAIVETNDAITRMQKLANIIK
jgi:hypothetical protein